MIRLTLSCMAGVGAGLLVLDRLTPRPKRSAAVGISSEIVIGLGVVAATVGFSWVLLGSPVVAISAGCCAAFVPRLVVERERRRRHERMTDAWPRMLDEARVLCGPGGLSLPQALFTAARSAAPELREAWRSAERTWELSADLPRSLRSVMASLDDPTTAVVCPTLEILHDAGGPLQHDQLGRLVEDRRRDASSRRTAEAELAGARFARRFVLIMPVAMALAGQSIGNGRAAFSSPAGQLAAMIALTVTAGCWFWSGRLLAVPTLSASATR